MLSKKTQRALLITAAAILLAALCVAAYIILFRWLPYNRAQNTMDPNGTVTVVAQADGSLRLSWPEGKNVQTYKLQVMDEDGSVLYSCSTGTVCSTVLPKLPMDRELLLRISSSHDYGKKIRPGDQSLEVSMQLTCPEIADLSWEADAEKALVRVSFDMSMGQLCSVYMATGEGEPVLVEELDEGKVTLNFGEGGAYTIPEHEVPLHFTFCLEKKERQRRYVGSTTEGFTLTREDLLGTVLNTKCVDNGENSYTLTWNETKGERYEVRLSDDGQHWQTLTTIPVGQERTYTTKNLGAFKDYQLWVVAVGGQTLPDSDLAADSTPVKVTTGARLLYSTIWPLMDQKVYADAAATQELGTATAGSAWCVLGMEGQYLKIRFNGQDGFIDSEYCMINLNEYVGELCQYNITNSYSSIYLVHEFGIDHVSGTVITGYEDVEVGDGEYLVPALFPTAQKLLKAGQAAREQGYTLKIYDSFRPKNATDRIYSLTAAILDRPVPVNTYSGKYVGDLDKLDWEPEKEGGEPEGGTEGGTGGVQPDDTTPETPETPEPSEPTTENSGAPEKKGIFFTEEEPWHGLMEGLTYRILMTNDGEYSLGAFLAPGNSKHNFGIAFDLTLVDANGNELPMQTSIHDLSWYSASKRNNGNAYKLCKIMTGAGFKDLYSEWWHYQDDEIFQKNKYEPLKTGVSWQCWVFDGEGWMYRLADGTFYTNCTQTIEGKTYTFDANGYTTQY